VAAGKRCCAGAAVLDVLFARFRLPDSGFVGEQISCLPELRDNATGKEILPDAFDRSRIRRARESQG
jgi:hypothetical protein